MPMFLVCSYEFLALLRVNTSTCFFIFFKEKRAYSNLSESFVLEERIESPSNILTSFRHQNVLHREQTFYFDTNPLIEASLKYVRGDHPSLDYSMSSMLKDHPSIHFIRPWYYQRKCINDKEIKFWRFLLEMEM